MALHHLHALVARGVAVAAAHHAVDQIIAALEKCFGTHRGAAGDKQGQRAKPKSMHSIPPCFT
jgi:hypothetical protein